MTTRAAAVTHTHKKRSTLKQVASSQPGVHDFLELSWLRLSAAPLAFFSGENSSSRASLGACCGIN